MIGCSAISPKEDQNPELISRVASEKQQPGPSATTEVLSLDELFEGTGYAGYNDFSKKGILAKVQEKLKNAGVYLGKVNGDAGPKTQAAMSAWQLSRGLPVTGRLDEATLRSLAMGHMEEKFPLSDSQRNLLLQSESHATARFPRLRIGAERGLGALAPTKGTTHIALPEKRPPSSPAATETPPTAPQKPEASAQTAQQTGTNSPANSTLPPQKTSRR